MGPEEVSDRMTEQVMVTNPAGSESDEQALLRRLRAGEDSAFGELFEVHAGAVRRLALGIAADRAEAEDITAETFFRVLQALRRGAGPRDHIRAYLLTVARRVSWEWQRSRRDVPVSDDELSKRAGVGADSNAGVPENSLITSAFTSLPERWRTVLWQTEVEGEQPAVVAPHFGLSPNATAALARRARLGLRAAYLQAHLKVSRSSDGCRSVVEKLGGYTAGSVTGAEARRIRAHLLGCPSCTKTHDELADVCSAMRAHAGAIVLLVPAAGLAFGASAGTGATTAAASGAAAGGAAAGGGLSAAAKTAFLGAKMKVGLAVASTAAVGALGVSVAPALLEDVTSQPMGLHGQNAPDLHVVETPAPADRAPAVVGPHEAVGGAVVPIAGHLAPPAGQDGAPEAEDRADAQSPDRDIRPGGENGRASQPPPVERAPEESPNPPATQPATEEPGGPEAPENPEPTEPLLQPPSTSQTEEPEQPEPTPTPRIDRPTGMPVPDADSTGTGTGSRVPGETTTPPTDPSVDPTHTSEPDAGSATLPAENSTAEDYVTQSYRTTTYYYVVEYDETTGYSESTSYSETTSYDAPPTRPYSSY